MSFAASAAYAGPTAVSEAVLPLSDPNLGLSTAEAGNVQQWLKRFWGFSGRVDGVLRPDSWMAFQRCLRANWGYTGAVNGVVGTDTVAALQRMPAARYGYTGPTEGVVDQATRTAFRRFADGDGPVGSRPD
ncbi:hypothetical protein [Streptomyces sp. NRRL S-646]|uniref:hypothetical protein n=1 Tax=Streptomyces sp. NRRL S-646 TaxID=1463917 RepID=UPI000690FD09|nr:hypothetical protein [Streptomyces sp. NRRL S-646]